MEIIPTINCPNFKCVKRRLEIAEGFGTGWVQIDVSDDKFGSRANWNNPEELQDKINIKNLSFYLEVHLMIEEPMEDVLKWLEIGVDRIIIHIESKFDFEKVLSKCEEYRAELMLAVMPETPIEEVFPYLEKINLVQILAVDPGPSGQSFQNKVMLKINTLLERAPGIIIEVDGGVDDKIAKRLNEEGVSIVASGSYIFESANPERRYKMLKHESSRE